MSEHCCDVEAYDASDDGRVPPVDVDTERRLRETERAAAVEAGFDG